MSDPVKSGRRGLGVGEGIGLAAVFISGLGLWNSWRGDDKQGPTEVVEKKTAVPLVLRGRVDDDGRALEIAPIEASHALQSLTLTVPNSGSVIESGSGGKISARAIESSLNRVDDRDGNTQRIVVRIAARYVEAGSDKSATGSYVISYKWEGGGLFEGKSLRIVDFRRA